jgi:hypothetical protein
MLLSVMIRGRLSRENRSKMKKEGCDEREGMLRNYLAERQLRQFDSTYEKYLNRLEYLEKNPDNVTDEDIVEISRSNKSMSRSLARAEMYNVCSCTIS